MGYKQELKRNFSTLEVFRISFSIITVLPSIASTLSYSIPTGPAGMVWVFIYIMIAYSYLANHSKGLVHSWRLHFTLLELQWYESSIRQSVSSTENLLFFVERTCVCYANIRRFILVDSFLCIREDSKASMFPCGILEHSWPRRLPLFSRLCVLCYHRSIICFLIFYRRLFSNVSVCHRHCS